MSVSSDPSPPQVQTPLSPNSPRVPVASPSSSPILNFLSQSPTAKSPSSLPYRGFGAPVFEEDPPEEFPATVHARRSGTTGRFVTPSSVAPESQLDRGAGLLRRLSLGSALAKPPNMDHTRSQSPPRPAAPPNSAITPTTASLPPFTVRRAKRSATVSIDSGRQRRAPSPMGERILKGHFDGFN